MTLHHQLHTLEIAELIRLASAPELAYLFRHTMVQETAYGSLVRADRKRLHLAAGEALEAAYAGEGQAPPPEVAAQLAQHFHSAGEPRAERYARLAAEAAMARYANTEAISLFTLALDWAVRGKDAAALAALYGRRGRALELNGQFAEALKNYQDLGAQAAARGDQRLALQALVHEGTLRATINPMFNPPEGHRLAEAALPLARALGDQTTEAKIHWNRLNLYRFAGNFREARVHGERSLAMARAAGAVEQEAATLNDLIHIYGGLGAWPEHQATAADASARWRALGNLPMLADSLATTSLYAAVRGDYDLSLAASAEGAQVARGSNNLWGQAYNLAGRTMAHWFRGEYAQALKVGRECIRLAEPSGFMAAKALAGSMLTGVLADLGQPEASLTEGQTAVTSATKFLPPLRPQTIALTALAHMALGDFAAAEAALVDAPLAAIVEMRWMTSQILRAHSELAVARRDPAALDLAHKRLAFVDAYQAPPYMVEARLTLAQAQRQAGAFAEARATLREAHRLAEAITMRRLLWQVLAELAGANADAGDASEAQALTVAAHAEADALAAGLPDPAMRATFEQWATATIAARAHNQAG